MESIIRRATSSDGAALVELYVRARRAGAAGDTIPPLAHDDDEVRNWTTHVVVPTLNAWVAELASGTLVGMLVLEAD